MTVREPGAPAWRTGPALAARRRSLPHLLLGAVLLVGSALGMAVVESRRDNRSAVVAIARPVPAGRIVQGADLAVARILPDPLVRTVAATRMADLVGRTAAEPLTAGTLLVDGQLGPVGWPPIGQAVIAVPVQAGHAPSALTKGSRVTVVVLPAGGQSGTVGTPVRAEAMVYEIDADAGQPGTSHVTLMLSDADATRIAAAPGDAVLIMRATG